MKLVQLGGYRRLSTSTLINLTNLRAKSHPLYQGFVFLESVFRGTHYFGNGHLHGRSEMGRGEVGPPLLIGVVI